MELNGPSGNDGEESSDFRVLPPGNPTRRGGTSACLDRDRDVHLNRFNSPHPDRRPTASPRARCGHLPARRRTSGPDSDGRGLKPCLLASMAGASPSFMDAQGRGRCFGQFAWMQRNSKLTSWRSYDLTGGREDTKEKSVFIISFFIKKIFFL